MLTPGDCVCSLLQGLMHSPRQRWGVLKEEERNFVAAFFHMAAIALTCTSMAQLGWFRIRGGQCAPHIAVYQFFNVVFATHSDEVSFKDSNLVDTSPVMVQYYSTSGSLQCVTPEVADLMRVIILLCFLAMLSSLAGFFLDIVGPTNKLYKCIRKNALPSIVTVVLIVAIIAVCYYITMLLEEEIRNLGLGAHVSYEYGCYTITAAGVVALCATACNLLQNSIPTQEHPRQQLLAEWDDTETFHSRETRLENIPPPPYCP